jgi:DNA-binding CsgD family transcriptional regulator/tetratricopeptide (TPR) repeat protein
MFSSTSTSGRVSSLEMIGRAAELARLRTALARASAGVPVAVIVSGEAGVGKTRLVGEFATRVRDEGIPVWSGRCLALTDGLLPYAPVVDLLRAIVADVGPARLRETAGSAAGRLAVLLPDLAPTEVNPAAGHGLPMADVAHPRLHVDLLDLIERLAGDPTVLVLEDLHWADRSTRALLSTLIGGLRHGRVLLVCTYRDGEVARDHPVASLLVELARSGVDRITLNPLGLAETTTHMAAIMPAEPSPAAAARVFGRSGGNPFLIEELVAAGPESDTLPEGLREILLMRARRLAPAIHKVLRAVALSGRVVDHGLLEQVVAMPPEQLLALIRTAVDRHLLVVDGDRYVFRHALVAEAVVADTLPGERIRLHRAIAEALTARARLPGPAELASTVAAEQAELAHHWAAAGDPDRALVAAVRAGFAAERAFAMPEARRHFEHALQLWWRAPDAREQTGVDLVELYRHAAETACTTGDVDDALAHVRRAIAEAGPSGDPLLLGMLYERLGRYLTMHTSAVGATVAAYETAVALVPPDATPARARVLAGLAGVLMLDTRMPESREWAQRALQLARHVGARQEEAHVLSTLGTVLTTLGQPDEGIAQLRAAVAMGAELDNVETMHRAYVNLSESLMTVGRFAESLEVGQRGAESARRCGATRSFGSVLRGNVMEALFYLGRWDEMAALLPATADRNGNPMQYMVLAHAAAVLHTAQGRFAEAELHLDEVGRALAEDALSGRRMLLHAARAELLLWQRQPAAALDWALTMLRAMASGDQGPATARLLAAATRAAADLAEGPGSTRADTSGMATLAVELEKSVLTASVDAQLALARAELSRARGESDPRPWADAAERWARLRCPYPMAYAQWRQAGALLAAHGQRIRAARLLSEAHQIALRLGARPLCAETGSLAQRSRLDLTVAALDAAAARPDPPFGLTRRELDVLGLIGRGNTNRQIAKDLFISEKTVSIHVSQVLAKLGVRNRGAAAALAHRTGLLTPAEPDQPAVDGPDIGISAAPR